MDVGLLGVWVVSVRGCAFWVGNEESVARRWMSGVTVCSVWTEWLWFAIQIGFVRPLVRGLLWVWVSCEESRLSGLWVLSEWRVRRVVRSRDLVGCEWGELWGVWVWGVASFERVVRREWWECELWSVKSEFSMSGCWTKSNIIKDSSSLWCLQSWEKFRQFTWDAVFFKILGVTF